MKFNRVMQFCAPPEFRFTDLKLLFTDSLDVEGKFYLFSFYIGHCHLYQYEMNKSRSESGYQNCNNVDDGMDLVAENHYFAENLVRSSLENKHEINVIMKDCYVFPAPILDIGSMGAEIFIVTADGVYTLSSSSSSCLNVENSIFDTSDDDIFSALIDDDDDEEGCSARERRKPIIIDKSFLKLKKYNIIKISSTSDKIVICVKDIVQNRWSIEVLSFSNASKERLISLDTLSTSYIQFTPIISDNTSSKSYMDPFEDNPYLNISQDFTVVLRCFEVKTDSLSNNKSRNVLNKKTFRAIFGGETVLLDSPVAIIGTPDGRVLWWPLRQWPQRSESPGYLCNLEQPICDMFVGHIFQHSKGKSADHDECLVVVGKLGKVVTVSAGENGSANAYFTVQYITSPVYSCVPCRTGVLHTSCDGTLWYSELKQKAEAQREQVEMKSHRLHFAALYVYMQDQLCDEVFCLMITGLLGGVSQSAIFRDASAAVLVESHEVEELLKMIYYCSDKLQEKQLLSMKQQKLLAELAVASDLMFGVSQKAIISCKTEEVKGHPNTYLLSVEYQNIALLNLSLEWWHLVVTLKEKYPENEEKTLSKSVPLSKGSTVEVLFKVHFLTTPTTFCLPVKVECGVQLSLPEQMQSVPEFFTVKTKLPIYICLKTVELNELWFLTQSVPICPTALTQQFAGCNIATFPVTASVEDTIHKMAKNRVTYELHKAKETENFIQKTLHFPKEMHISVFKTTARSILSKAGRLVENDAELPKKMLQYLVSNGQNIENLINDNKHNIYCLGDAVSFCLSIESDYLNIKIYAENVHILSCLRNAVIGFLAQSLPNDYVTSQTQVHVSRQCLSCAQSIMTEVLQCLCKEERLSQDDEVIKIYYMLRERISRNLPLL